MDASIKVTEIIFLASSTGYIVLHAFALTPFLGALYFAFVLAVLTGVLQLRSSRGGMVFTSPLALFNAFFYLTILLGKTTNTQVSGMGTVTAGSTQTESFRPLFTIPSDVGNGATLLPNINDPEAVDAQTVCPGYKGSEIIRTESGLTATLTLAGKACNVYGNDVETLTISVEYQSVDRLSVNIHPTNIGSKNSSWYILPEYLVPRPNLDADAGSTSLKNDLGFFWNNNPTFSFSIIRLSTGDVLFSTEGTKIVYEDQFIEFVSALPENYNLYGLGESIHGLRLGNNFTKVGETCLTRWNC